MKKVYNNLTIKKKRQKIKKTKRKKFLSNKKKDIKTKKIFKKNQKKKNKRLAGTLLDRLKGVTPMFSRQNTRYCSSSTDLDEAAINIGEEFTPKDLPFALQKNPRACITRQEDDEECLRQGTLDQCDQWTNDPSNKEKRFISDCNRLIYKGAENKIHYCRKHPTRIGTCRKENDYKELGNCYPGSESYNATVTTSNLAKEKYLKKIKKEKVERRKELERQKKTLLKSLPTVSDDRLLSERLDEVTEGKLSPMSRIEKLK